ncbi:MAG: hypothetical protein M9949_09010 [Candidatus Kapabacteria bacterium]|nr:hypothetical protein [Candidatus Kapabacteria bacterium]
MKLMILFLLCAFLSVAICQNDVQLDEDFKFPEFKNPCEFLGNPSQTDNIYITSFGLKKAKKFMGVELFEHNLYETLKSKENDFIYIGRVIENDGWRVLGIHILADVNKHYFLTVCFKEKWNLECKYYTDRDNEDFEEVFVDILNNYKFDFYLYEGEMTDYMNDLHQRGEWTDYDYINRLDSLQNEMRMRKNLINDK